MGKRLNNVVVFFLFFSEAIVFRVIKVGKFSQLNEYMNLHECQRSRSFIDLGPNHSDSIYLTSVAQKPQILMFPQHSGERYRTNGPLV